MTKEEAIENLKLVRLNAAMTGAASFKKAIDLAIVALSKPSLPSNLDEAAFNYAEACQYDGAEKLLCVEHFKAAVEWMAGQGVSMLGRVGIYGVDVESITKELREAGFNLGEEIILQIRKKYDL